MAQLTTFAYYPEHSLIHGLDARFKVGFVVLISVSSLNANLTSLLALSIFLGLVMGSIRLSLIRTFREIRYLFLFLVAIILLRACTTPGNEIIAWKWITLSLEGFREGLIVSWRLVLIVLVGLALVATTKPSQIKAAVEWYLKPVPFLPHKRIAVMISLTMRFMPVILNQVKETDEAQKARCIGNRKNPLYRLKKLVIPVVLRSFETADRLATAMEARCYSDNRTDPEFSSQKSDWLALLVVTILSGLIWCAGCK